VKGSVDMSTVTRNISEYGTREDFSRSFVPAFACSLELAKKKLSGEDLENDGDEWLERLKSEAGELRLGN
jgi:hypothetical protein